MKFRKIVSFVLDNQVVSIDLQKENFSPTMTLLHYLRSLPGHKGTKEGCGEGDCGACTVVIAEICKDRLYYKAVDSCLIFLPQIHGKQIITIENLEYKSGQENTTLHPVQKAIIDEHATQCGFCTPGIAMSMFSLARNHPRADDETIRQALSGNLCRCTGYHSILKAAKKASAKPQEDHFCKTEAKIKQLLHPIVQDNTCIHISTNSQKYFKPFTLNDLLTLKSDYPDALVISGSTDVALRVTKKHEIIPLIIDISDVREIADFRTDKKGIVFGAGMKLEQVRELSKKYFPVLYNMLSVFGSMQIRNMATMGGNVGSASPIGDTIPVLFAHQTLIMTQNTKGERLIPIEQFITGYRTTALSPDEIITGIYIPYPAKGVIIRSYKVSKRKELDISTVSSCFRIGTDKSGIITDVILAYGGMAAFTKRAINTENFLKGKPWTPESINKASGYLEKDFTPLSDARAGKEMRMIAAKNLLVSFFHDIQTQSS